MAKLSEIERNNQHYGYMFMCLGCDNWHQITDTGEKAWRFNGNIDRPTFSPSYLCWNDPNPNVSPELDPDGRFRNGFRCHSFIRDGKIEYLSDCTHELAGQTLELPELDQPPKETL